MLFFTALLAGADFLQAGVGRRIVADLSRDGVSPRAGRSYYHGGDSFTGSLLGYAGWKSLFPSSPLKAGDMVLYNEVVMPRWWFRDRAPRLRLAGTYAYPSRLPLRLMDNAGSAGFYASAWGALPWTFSRGPLERYLLLEVVAENGAS